MLRPLWQRLCFWSNAVFFGTAHLISRIRHGVALFLFPMPFPAIPSEEHARSASAWTKFTQQTLVCLFPTMLLAGVVALCVFGVQHVAERDALQVAARNARQAETALTVESFLKSGRPSQTAAAPSETSEADKVEVLSPEEARERLLAQLASGDASGDNKWLDLAQIELALNNTEAATRILDQHIADHSGGRWRELKANCFAQEFDTLWKTADHDQRQQAIRLIIDNLSEFPRSPWLLNRVIVIAEYSDKGRQFAQDLLKPLATSSNRSPTVFLALGVIAAREERYADAVKHCRAGLAMAPNRAELLNNLAWSLMRTEPADLSAALEAANNAVRHAPFRPEYRETRGQIHARMENWTDCIVDLERCLQRLPNHVDTRSTLAIAYARIGDQDLSKMHLSRIAETNPELAKRVQRVLGQMASGAKPMSGMFPL